MAEPPSESQPSSCKQIKLSIQSAQDNRALYYRIKRDTPLQRLLLDYSTRLGLDRNTIRFIYEGQRVKDSSTPEDLDMHDRTTIDALAEQFGGG